MNDNTNTTTQRKVVQLLVVPRKVVQLLVVPQQEGHSCLYAVADDGTMWRKEDACYWEQLPNLPCPFYDDWEAKR